MSGCNSESANVEHFIDYHLQPIATSIPSFIRDSLHFKSLLSDLDIRDSDILFSLDVQSLYTNIPIQQGIASVKQALSEHVSTAKNRPDKFILALLELTLLHNDFQFNNETYLQTKGTAMGKKYAPIFANIFMHYWEQQALRLLITLLYFGKRYIDDIFGIWRHSEDQLHTLFNTSIPSTPTLKLALLAICIRLIIWSATSLKITPNFQQKFFSNQQTHTNFYILNLIIPHMSSKALLKRNYFAIFDYHHISVTSCNPYRILKSNLLNYGYTRSFIRICKQSALSLTKCQCNSMITGCQPCRFKQCQMCFYTRSTAILNSNLHNHTFPITQNTCCNTRNCIYTIHCTLCTHIPTIYVGETKNCIRSRFSQHNTTSPHTTKIQSYLNISIKPITTYLCSEFLYFNSYRESKNSRKTDFMRKKI